MPGNFSGFRNFGGMDRQEFTQPGEPIALIVDDEPLILMDIADMVSKEGFAVFEATTAEQGYEFLTQHPLTELLFTDVEMPGPISGFELARKAADRWPHICVVVASGAASPQNGDLPETAIWVTKPISPELVHEIIAKHCRHDTIA
jgi:CheY-like chemotaxis protein